MLPALLISGLPSEAYNLIIFFFNFSASTLKPKIITDTVVIEKTFLKDLVEGSFFCDYSYAFIR